MRTDLFDFALPEDRIALRPASPRDAARLLVVRPRNRGARGSHDARSARTATGGRRARRQRHQSSPRACTAAAWRATTGAGDRGEAREAARRLALDRAGPAGQAACGRRRRAFRQRRPGLLPRSARRHRRSQRGGRRNHVLPSPSTAPCSTRRWPSAARCRCRPTLPAAAPSTRPIHRLPDDVRTRGGSVAAPTAGLHFTEAIVTALRARGIALHKVTLHVGPGTFLPVKADDTRVIACTRNGAP